MNVYEEVGATLLRETGVTVVKWRAGNSGVADWRSADWEIEAPHPRGPVSFGVFAHEVAHQLLHRTGSKPRWRQEVEAEEWALAQFDRFGLPGRDQYERNAAKHLAWSFCKAIRRSPRLTAVIINAYPEWWARAEASGGYAAKRLARVTGAAA